MTRFFARRLSALTIVVCATSVACYGDDAAPKVPLGQVATADSASQVAEAHSLLGDKARAALDSGNVLFRKKQYTPSLAMYREASELAPQHAAPFFGVYMVARAMNNTAMADSALAEIKKRNGPLPAATHQVPGTAPSVAPGTVPPADELHKSVPKKGAARVG